MSTLPAETRPAGTPIPGGDAGPGQEDLAGLRLLCLLPSIPLGGMERAVLRLCQELGGRGAAVHVVAEDRWGVEVHEELEKLQLPWSGMALPWSLRRPRTLLEATTIVKSLLVSRRQIASAARAFEADALLATGIHSAFAARHLARKSGLRSVFRVPNPPFLSGRGLGDRLNAHAWRAVGESFDAIVCNSRYTADLVIWASGVPDKVHVIRNFPPTLPRLGVEPAPSLTPGRRHVVYLGQISRQKGLDQLLTASEQIFDQFEDVDLTIAGPEIWQSNYGDELRDRIRASAHGSRVQILGPVGDVHGLLKQACIHVCPSTSKGDSFPNVILDAKQAGVPSIVFPTAGLPEAVQAGEGIVTAAPTAESLASALGDLLADADRRDAMARCALESLSRHDPETLCEAWRSVLDPSA